MIPTPHIQAGKGMIAKTILLPGDPLRAKFIAENYLEGAQQFNAVRNMLGYTGTYKGKKVSVMGSGMGMPSMALYSYELINFYGVKNLIRVGSAGSMQEDVKIRDIVFAMSASTNSNYQSMYNLPGGYCPTASWELLSKAVNNADEMGVRYKVGNILSTDIFYNEDAQEWKRWAAMGTLAVEMECAALYMNAARAGVNALGILTISDSLVTKAVTTPDEREKTFTDMMEIALDCISD